MAIASGRGSGTSPAWDKHLVNPVLRLKALHQNQPLSRISFWHEAKSSEIIHHRISTRKTSELCQGATSLCERRMTAVGSIGTCDMLRPGLLQRGAPPDAGRNAWRIKG